MSSSESSTFPVSRIVKGRAARLAGALLLATAVLTAVMVYARVSADSDRGTMLLSLQAIADNGLMYGLSGAMRLLSGLTFLAAGLLLLRTWIIRQGLATQVVPYLFVLSGAFTSASGACGAYSAKSGAGGYFCSRGQSHFRIYDHRIAVQPALDGREDRLCRCRCRARYRSALPVARRRHIAEGSSRFGGTGRRNAIHLAGLSHNPASDHRHRVLPLAADYRRDALDGQS